MDLEVDTQNQLFQKMILSIDPAKLSENGMFLNLLAIYHAYYGVVIF